MRTSSRPHRDERGIALAIVLVIVLLLSLVVTTFASRSITDGLISRNRDRSSEAAALARGGVRLAAAVLFQYRVHQRLSLLDPSTPQPKATLDTFWATLDGLPGDTRRGASLQIKILDTASRLNLNVLVPAEEEDTGVEADSDAEAFLTAFFEKVKDEIVKADGSGGDAYEPREMARNLLDYMDGDDIAISGRNEDDYYLQQDPPHRAANRPLLSVGEVAMVEGFDAGFVKAMEPYVTVHPYVLADGINMNTAPPHVLALIYHGSSGDRRLEDEDVVRSILKARRDDRIVCDSASGGGERCLSLSELQLGEGSVYPEATLPSDGNVFEIISEVRLGGITKISRATLDVTNHEEPLLLSWETR